MSRHQEPHTTLDTERLEQYLSAVFPAPVHLVRLARPGERISGESLKEFGYGTPIKLDFEVDGQRRSAVLHTIRPGPFGHEHRADRAAELFWSHHAFNRLPRHVRSIDLGAFQTHGPIRSLDGIEELFLLTDYVDGREYAHDLARLRDGAALTDQDRDRADALCDYLVEIHQTKCDQPDLYVRRVRELIGHSQCIMGLIDSYPADHPWITPRLLESIEQRAVGSRWRVKKKTHRLAQVHGDFHPWNILFGYGLSFHVLDRSRGEWGDPADDLTALTINYVFESLQATGRFEGAFAELFQCFWDRYLQRSGDQEALDVAAPFIAFRGLVLASPVWYPHITEPVRRGMITLVEAVLDAQRFEPGRIDEYLQGKTR